MIYRNKLLKTPRNILISYVAVSDILLCLFTMPFTLLDLIHHWWPIGSGQVIFSLHLSEEDNKRKTLKEFLCKMTTTSQSVFVFFASFSVVIIALDRMRFVVTPDKVQLNNKMVKLIHKWNSIRYFISTRACFSR